MKYIKKFESRFLDEVINVYSIGKVYFLKGSIKTDPLEIIMLSRKPNEDDDSYWGWSIGIKDKGQIQFNPRVYEKDIFHPSFIEPSKSDKVKIKEHLEDINFEYKQDTIHFPEKFVDFLIKHLTNLN